jgi:hypothetical protein
MKNWIISLLCLLTFQAHADKPQLWLYYATNLAVDKNVDALRDIWTRAAKAGYTRVLLTDSKFAKLGDLGEMTGHYFGNMARAKKVAAELKLELVPAMFDIGYSNNMLWHDPNLAEGLPVKDQPFIVKSGETRPSSETHFPTKFGFKDDVVNMDGGVATVKDNPANARFTYAMKLSAYRCYHISVKIKTDDYKGTPEIHVRGNTNRDLQWQNLGVKHTQDWTEHHVVFNTLDSESVTIYFGVWGDAKGTLRWKDWQLEEAGLVNVLRRPGAPFIVKTESGQTLTEGQDFEPVADPKLGSVPWKGEYHSWHEPVTIKTKLPDGTKLLVSWYHPAIVYDGQVSACIGEPRMNELLADQAKRMKEAFGAKAYMMSHDEFRTLGWDESCGGAHKFPGEMLAENARYCTKLLEGSRTYVWSDMFDPFHNAVKGPYYLVNGPWTGSWEGLGKEVVIVNWNYGKRGESLKFFADRGHHQVIAAYYDGPMEQTKNWVESARKVTGVEGFMYTTWRGDYSKVEEFAKVCGGASDGVKN